MVQNSLQLSLFWISELYPQFLQKDLWNRAAAVVGANGVTALVTAMRLLLFYLFIFSFPFAAIWALTFKLNRYFAL